MYFVMDPDKYPLARTFDTTVRNSVLYPFKGKRPDQIIVRMMGDGKLYINGVPDWAETTDDRPNS